MDYLGTFAKLVAILLMIAGVPGYLYLINLTKDPVLSLIFFIIYEIVVFVVGFLSKIGKGLEDRWAERLTNHIDVSLQHMVSGYRRRYLEYMALRHRWFDVKGLRFHGPFNLELERVFVELSVDPTPIHQISSNPLASLPENLRSGTHTIWEFLSDRRMGNLAILGSPGCGKTTLLKHMALTLALSANQRKHSQAPNLLPILLFLRDHAADIKANPEIKLAKLIRDQLERREAPLPPSGWLEGQLNSGSCLIMLDGLDEVADIATRKCVISWVERCMEAYGKNRFVLSSRPYGYLTNPLATVTVLQIRPFTSQQVRQFVQNWYLANEFMRSKTDDTGVRMDAKLEAEDLIRRLYSTPTLSDLAVNPLLLTMIANVHLYRSSLPGRRVELYAEICEVSLGKRQEARGMEFDLTPAQKQRVLQPLAYWMMYQRVREIKREAIPSVIASDLAAVSQNVESLDFIKDIENSSGLFVERETGLYSFSHLTFQEYLAAVHILQNRLEAELLTCVEDSWWQETIRLYCAQTDASNVIEACLDASTAPALGLAIDCMEESREKSPHVRAKYQAIIQEGYESPDPERRRLIAEARLKTRLKGRENTFIDTSLITCAEYQLFLDEMRALGKYYQPDHWRGYQFPAGQAQAPILGIRRSDALAFCDWLTQRENSQWRYRIPTLEEASSHPVENKSSAPLGYWISAKPKSYQIFRTAPAAELPPIPDIEHLRSLSEKSEHDTDVNRLRLSDLDLARDLERGQGREQGSELERNLNLARVRDFAREINHLRSSDRDLARDLEFIRLRNLDHYPDPAHAAQLALYLARNCDLALMLNLTQSKDHAAVGARPDSLSVDFLSLDLNLDHDFDHALDSGLHIARTLNSAPRGNQLLKRFRDLERDASAEMFPFRFTGGEPALNRDFIDALINDCSLAKKLARDHFKKISRVRSEDLYKLAYFLNFALLYQFLNTTLNLLMLQLRRNNAYPVFEGLRIVKEHKEEAGSDQLK